MSKEAIVIGVKKKKSFLGEWANAIIFAAIFAIAFRSILLEPFNIPSGSMIPTLQVGDHLLVSKPNWGYSRFSFPFGSWRLFDGRFFAFSEPKQGDIAVFRKPGDKIEYVKRIIGMPGDKIQVRHGRLIINNKMMERENPRQYIIADLFCNHDKSRGFAFADKSGKQLLVRGNQIYQDGMPVDFNFTINYADPSYGRRECYIYDGLEWTEILPNGARHQIVELSDAIGRAPDGVDYDNTEATVVPDGHYFMMGDDRDLSADSRSSMGAVPRDNLIGRVWFVFYSHNYYAMMPAVWDWMKKMRWERFGLSPE